MVTVGRQGGRDREFGIDRYILRYLKWITNKALLYNIGGEGDGTPLQDSCLENPVDGGAWWTAFHGIDKSRTQLSDFTFIFCIPIYMCTYSVVQSCATLCDPIDGSPPGSPVPGILQARTLECGAISFSNA